jgi:hypothetical protein
MKAILFCGVLSMASTVSISQTKELPHPEFLNEVYGFASDSNKLVRLEKQSVEANTRSKAAGFGGVEHGYYLEGAESKVSLTKGTAVTFVYATKGAGSQSTTHVDDQNPYAGMNPNEDPATNIGLYKLDKGKGIRKLLLVKSGGMVSFGKSKATPKLSISVRSVRDGFWEFIPDNDLKPGDYAFLIGGQGGMMPAVVYAFAIK